MGFFAFAGIVIVALVIGIAVQMYDKRALSHEWLIIAFAGTFGAYFASENFPGATVPLLEGIKDWGPSLESSDRVNHGLPIRETADATLAPAVSLMSRAARSNS